MADQQAETPLRLLVINPNTSQPMTDALKPMVQDLGYNGVGYTPPVYSSFLYMLSG